jgi:hypothetical protein
MGVTINAYKTVVGKPQGKRLLDIWEDNIKSINCSRKSLYHGVGQLLTDHLKELIITTQCVEKVPMW